MTCAITVNNAMRVVKDDTYDRGYVGITMFKSSNPFTTLMVDWAKLTVLGKLTDYGNAIEER